MPKKKNVRDHHLLERNGMYYYRGAGYKFSLNTNKVSVAREMRDEFCKQIALTGRIDKEVLEGTPTFNEMVEMFLQSRNKMRPITQHLYKKTLGIFTRLWDRKFITDITTRDINRWIVAQDTSARTINQRLKVLTTLFKFAVRQGYITDSPINNVEKPKNRPTTINPLTHDEVETFLDNVDAHYKDYFTVAFYTGMRPEELVGLKVKYVDFNNDVIQVQEVLDALKKTHGPKTPSGIREIPMFPMVKAALLRQTRDKVPGDYVFSKKQGKGPIKSNSLNMCVWTPTLKKVGLEHRVMYSTRHTFATLMIDAGESPGSVARWLGHSSLTQLYKVYYRFLERKKQGEGSAFMSKYFNGDDKNTSNVVPLTSHPTNENVSLSKVG